MVSKALSSLSHLHLLLDFWVVRILACLIKNFALLWVCQDLVSALNFDKPFRCLRIFVFVGMVLFGEFTICSLNFFLPRISAHT